MTVKVRGRGRGIAAPLEGESLSTILRHLREQVLAGDAPVEVAKRTSRPDVRTGRDDADAGRLRWSFLESRCDIFYTDEQGRKHRMNRGLKVPREDAVGRPLSGEAFQKARRAALRKARALWNELDKSSCARYEVSRVS